MSSRNGMGWDGLAQAHTPHRHSLLEGVTASPASALSAKIGISLLPGLGTSSGWINSAGAFLLCFPFCPQASCSWSCSYILPTPSWACWFLNHLGWIPSPFPRAPGWGHTCWRCCWNSLGHSKSPRHFMCSKEMFWGDFLCSLWIHFPLILPLCVSFFLFPSQYPPAWSISL